MKDSKPIKSNWLVEVQHLQICTWHLNIDNPKKDNLQANYFFFFNLFFGWKVWGTYTMDWSAGSSLCVDAQSILIILSTRIYCYEKREIKNADLLCL